MGNLKLDKKNGYFIGFLIVLLSIGAMFGGSFVVVSSYFSFKGLLLILLVDTIFVIISSFLAKSYWKEYRKYEEIQTRRTQH